MHSPARFGAGAGAKVDEILPFAKFEFAGLRYVGDVRSVMIKPYTIDGRRLFAAESVIGGGGIPD